MMSPLAIAPFLALIYILGSTNGKYLLVEVEPGNKNVIVGYIYKLTFDIVFVLLNDYNEKQFVSFYRTYFDISF